MFSLEAKLNIKKKNKQPCNTHFKNSGNKRRTTDQETRFGSSPPCLGRGAGPKLTGKACPGPAHPSLQKPTRKKGLQRILPNLKDLFLEIWVNYSIYENSIG